MNLILKWDELATAMSDDEIMYLVENVALLDTEVPINICQEVVL